jgi:hypothetical protein
MIEVLCMEQKKYSTCKDNVTALTEINWSEHMFLEAPNVDKQQAEDAKITINVMDKGFFKN